LAQSPEGKQTTVETRSDYRSERVEVDRPRFLGVDPTVAMVLGAVLVVVIVIALVAMSRRSEEVESHSHRRV
jgi:hypothetical protein